MTLPHAGTGLRLRVEFEPSLLSTAAHRSGANDLSSRPYACSHASKPGLQRAWFCAPSALRTVAELAAALAARFGADDHNAANLVLEAGGYTLPHDAALSELLRDGDRVTVACRSEPGVHAPKRARTRSGGSAPDGDDDISDGEVLPGAAMRVLPQPACALHDQLAVRSRSARRKALKRARRRQMVEAADELTLTPCAAHAPPLVSLPVDGCVRDSTHGAAKVIVASVTQRAPVLLPAEESTTSDSYDAADAAVPDACNTLDRAAGEQLRAFERWVVGEVSSSEADDEPPRMDFHALRVGDVISYRVVELSTTGVPQISPRRRSVVTTLSAESNTVALAPHPEAARIGGLVAAARLAPAAVCSPREGDTPPCSSLPFNPDGSIELAVCELLCVKQHSAGGELVQSAPLDPDLATTLIASASALAAARRLMSPVCRRSPEQLHQAAQVMEAPADVLPTGDEPLCGAAPSLHAAVAMPAVAPCATRTAMRGGGVAGALARLRKADDAAVQGIV